MGLVNIKTSTVFKKSGNEVCNTLRASETRKLYLKSIKTFGRTQRYNDYNTAKKIQQNDRDNDNGIL
jgi:hypothetical protein